MNKSQILLEFLRKNCKIEADIPQSEEERFEYYMAAINKIPTECASESFLRIEDGYLKEELGKKEIIDAAKGCNNISINENFAAHFKADAVLSFLSVGGDKSVYLYGGTRLKQAVSLALAGKEIAVTKANNVNYKGVISAVLPNIDSKLTSGILQSITNKYRFALDLAMDNKLESVVLCVPRVDNTLLSDRIATTIVNEIKSHPYYNSLKIVLSAPDAVSFGTYKKAIGE